MLPEERAKELQLSKILYNLKSLVGEDYKIVAKECNLGYLAETVALPVAIVPCCNGPARPYRAIFVAVDCRPD